MAVTILRNFMATKALEYLKRYQNGEQVDLLDKWINAQLGREGELELHRERFDYQITQFCLHEALQTFNQYRDRLNKGETQASLADWVKAEAKLWPNEAEFLAAVRGHVLNMKKRQTDCTDPKSVMSREIAKMKKATGRK